MYNAAMYNCIVSDAYIISNKCTGLFICAMNDGAILHIYLIAQADDIYISPNNSIEPNAALVAHNHIANNSAIKQLCPKAGILFFIGSIMAILLNAACLFYLSIPVLRFKGMKYFSSV